MKTLIIIIYSVFLLFTACSNKDLADAYGSFNATEITLSSEVSGTVVKINSKEGETVENGTLIAIIDTTQYALNLQEIESSLEIAATRIRSAEQQIELLNIKQKSLLKDKRRFENLLQQEAASQKQLDDINTSLQLIEKQIDQARTALELHNLELQLNKVKKDQVISMFEKCFLKAPLNSTILDVYVNEGELAGPGRPVLKLADMSLMTAVFYIAEPQLAQLNYNDKIKVFIDDSSGLKEFTGTVSFISSKAEFTPKTIQTKDERVKLVYKVEADVENDGSLKIGMPLEVRF